MQTRLESMEDSKWLTHQRHRRANGMNHGCRQIVIDKLIIKIAQNIVQIGDRTKYFTTKYRK